MHRQPEAWWNWEWRVRAAAIEVVGDRRPHLQKGVRVDPAGMNDEIIEITIEDILRIFHIPVEQADQVRLADAEEYLRIAGYLVKTIT